MLIVDVSNLAHIGVNSRREVLYNDIGFKAIPFILSKVASMIIDTENIIFVFDPKVDGKRLDYFRTYNPQVVFETNVFYDLLTKIGFNAVRVPGYKADDIICGIAERYQETPGKKIILTEDRDMVAAVYLDNETGGTTELLGPTINGDHITPFNMYDLINIPYNFTNVCKTLLGCKSDKIPPLPGGGVLWKDFQMHIAKKRFIIRGRVENAYQHIDISRYNNKEYLLNWLAERGVDGKENADKVYPKLESADSFVFKKGDWRLYNTLFHHMFGKIYINQRRNTGKPSPQTISFIDKTLENNRIQDASVFDALPIGAINTLEGLEDFNLEIAL